MPNELLQISMRLSAGTACVGDISLCTRTAFISHGVLLQNERPEILL